MASSAFVTASKVAGLEERLAALDPSRVLPAAPPEGWDAPVKKLALDMASRSI